eukprot:SAG31_NODE_598_length_13651_cov_10.681818_10_plen_341_part_00
MQVAHTAWCITIANSLPRFVLLAQWATACAPIRCVVNVTFTQLPSPSAAAAMPTITTIDQPMGGHGFAGPLVCICSQPINITNVIPAIVTKTLKATRKCFKMYSSHCNPKQKSCLGKQLVGQIGGRLGFVWGFLRYSGPATFTGSVVATVYTVLMSSEGCVPSRRAGSGLPSSLVDTCEYLMLLLDDIALRNANGTFFVQVDSLAVRGYAYRYINSTRRAPRHHSQLRPGMCTYSGNNAVRAIVCDPDPDSYNTPIDSFVDQKKVTASVWASSASATCTVNTRLGFLECVSVYALEEGGNQRYSYWVGTSEDQKGQKKTQTSPIPATEYSRSSGNSLLQL